MRDFVWLTSAAVLLAIIGLVLTYLPGTAQPATPSSSIGLPTCATTAPATPASPSAGSGPPATWKSAILELVADIPLPGDASRFDYQSFDPTTGRLYIAHMGAGQLVVFDTSTRTVVGTVDDLPTVTGVLAVPEVGRVYAAVAGDHEVAVIDSSTLAVVARLGPIGFPDGLAFAPESGEVFISDESGGGELVIDAATDTVVTTIDLDGEAGNTHYDAGSGCIVVAVQSHNQLVAINPTSHQVVGRYGNG